MKNKFNKWRQTGRCFLGRGWNRARPNSAGNKCRKCSPLCFILKQLPLPVLPEWFHEFIFRSGCGKGLGHAVVEFRRVSGPKSFLFQNGTSGFRQNAKMPPMTTMKNRLKIMRHGKKEKFILCNGLHKRSRDFCQNVSRK
jgi:hypothetical protein